MSGAHLYEIEESDAYLGARDLLLRRVNAWTGANGLVKSPTLAGALLDSRHFSSDGRLGYWTPARVRRALQLHPDSVEYQAVGQFPALKVGPNHRN